ncbi:MAG TPA: ATP-binding cassette domain-containing protein [Phototrophicaceae bacterium]|nr:ATP-binding cassette domain-containing protein [Phototrophicaceae bacterium]
MTMHFDVQGTYLALEGIVKHFITTRRVLRGIDLEIQPSEFIAVVGKSGCGKSTLLRVIAGLETPDSGTVTVENQKLTGQNNVARVMFQDARLLPWKRVIDNAGLGLKGDWKAQAEEALDHVGLLDRAHDFPAVLSGGERQRVALARALISRPPLLLLDEPLGALDALTRIEMQQLIERLWQEHCFTALLITHDVDEALVLADRVVLLEDGVVALNIPVTLPRPRDRSSVEFARLKGIILNRVMGLGLPEPASVSVPQSQPDYPTFNGLKMRTVPVHK